jgi:peptide/nickel transport system permease protein
VGTFIIRRLLGMIPMLFAITIFTFLMMHAAPGNAIDAMINPSIRDIEQLKEHLREINGLNDPLWLQYVHWLEHFVVGNWGFSFNFHQPVIDLVGPALANTLLLAVVAEVLTLLIGIPIGMYQARHPYSKFDYTASTISFVLYSIPYYILALLLIYLFAITLQIFPAQGATGTGPLAGTFIDHLYHALLPALSIAIANMAVYTRYTRGAMLEVIRKDFTRTAYAKGLSEGRVFRKHVFRNAMIPLVTQFGFDIGSFAGGFIILEGLFQYQGMGYLTITAVSNRDYPVIMATTVLFAVCVLLGNLIADILYALVDPRIRYN